MRGRATLSDPGDWLLTGALVGALPAYMVRRSVAAAGALPQDRVERYRRTMMIAGVLMTALAIQWWVGRRPLAWLGLGWPSGAGWVGLVLAAVAIAALLIVAPRAKQPRDPARLAAAAAALPQTARELRWFVAFAFLIGAAWELLYRGYLFWVLAPALGGAGAVLVMGAAYGAAHGWRGAKPFAGSLAAALLFATGYALTGSLWWLIVLHTALPLVGLRSRPRAAP